jgi:S-adenosylmethionine-diacylglycerol 3-amino-3-carboxypropyl transferase
MTERRCVPRERLHDAFDGRLLFANVREDPAVEAQLLEPEKGGRLVIVGSGGCTALSLLAVGNCEVVAVDANSTQNHLTELKAAALGVLDAQSVVGFLGGHPRTADERLRLWPRVSERLSPAARDFWQAHLGWVANGILRAGATERFIAAIRWLVSALVQPRRSIPQLLSAQSLDEQRALYDRLWNNRRWRGLFHLLLNRFVMGKTLDARLFVRANVRSVAGYFLERFEHGICRIPVATNYFLHHMLTGFYPPSGALPPYLAQVPVDTALRERFSLTDGSMTAYLKTCATGSVRGFALSNICEWMSDRELEELLREVSRVATAGARVVIRNFLGWTEIPARVGDVIKEDNFDASQLMRGERSLMQRRVLVCRVDKAA